MTPLWLAALALLLLALACLLAPLLAGADRAEREEERLRNLHASRHAELQRDLGTAAMRPDDGAIVLEEAQRLVLEDLQRAASPRRDARWLRWVPAGVLSVLLPLAAVLLYVQVGDPQAAAFQVLAAQQQAAHDAGDEAMLAAMTTRLAQRLQAQPQDLEGWVMLARSYAVLERHQAAATAYRKAMALAPGQPDLLADFADTLASARGGKLEGEPRAAIEEALAIDANHPKALALAGMSALRSGDGAAARRHWQHLLAQLEPGSPMAQRVRADLASLDAGAVVNVAASAPVAAPASAPGARSITGQVTVAPALREQVRVGDTLFVVARAAGAGRMPVAALRLQVTALPVLFVLDDSHAMSPELTLSRFPAVSIEARISRSGNAIRQPGDLFGAPQESMLGRGDLRIVIDQVLR